MGLKLGFQANLWLLPSLISSLGSMNALILNRESFSLPEDPPSRGAATAGHAGESPLGLFRVRRCDVPTWGLV